MKIAQWVYWIFLANDICSKTTLFLHFVIWPVTFINIANVSVFTFDFCRSRQTDMVTWYGYFSISPPRHLCTVIFLKNNKLYVLFVFDQQTSYKIFRIFRYIGECIVIKVILGDGHVCHCLDICVSHEWR